MTRRRHEPDRNTGTVIAFFALLATGVGLVLLIGAALNSFYQALALLGLGLGVFGFGALHWLLWGRAMTRANARREDEEPARRDGLR